MSSNPTRDQLEKDLAQAKKRIAELDELTAQNRQTEEILQQQTHKLGERIKELNCLYGIANLIEEPNITLAEILQGVVDLIPPSMQYPEITGARIVVGDQLYSTENFRETDWQQTSDICVFGSRTGSLAVCCLEKMPQHAEGPFVAEERDLINAITTRLGRMIERKQAQQENDHFIESLGRVDQEIRQSANLDELLEDVIEAVFNIFGCDRAWLLYPCNPEATTLTVRYETCRAEYPGGKIRNQKIPNTPARQNELTDALTIDQPITYGPGNEKPFTSDITAEFQIQSQMFMAVHAKTGEPWLFGMHQCSHARVWSDHEKKLFNEIGRRLTDGISSLLFFRDLEKRDTQYSMLAENVVDIIWSMDMDLRLTYVSPSVKHLRGYSVEEALTQTLDEILVPASQELALSLLSEKLQLISVEDESGWTPLSFDAEQICKDGSTIHTHNSTTILKGPDGKPNLIVGVTHDISDRVQAEKAMLESEEKHRALIENLSEIILILDKDGVNRWNSPSVRQFGIEPEDAIGINALDFTHPDDRDRVAEKLRYVVENPGRVTTIEALKVVPTEGEVAYLDDTMVYLPDTPGIHGIVVTGHDVTERVLGEKTQAKLTEQLQQSQKMEAIGRLAGGVAHDFNNILTGITGYTEMIQSSIGANDPLWADLEEIRTAAERAAGLTRQLLAFSRKQIIDPKVVQPNVVLENSQKMLKRIIGEDIEFIFKRAADLWRVRIDYTQLDQILVNLAVNARDAMPDGGRLLIETANITLPDKAVNGEEEMMSGDFVMLTVADTGSGMTAETMEHVFEPFYSTKGRDKGTGLGLATVYGIVKQNNGFIDVSSEPDAGTMFRIYLPAVMAEADTHSGRKEPEQAVGTETILLVEDDAMVRTLAKKILVRHGYNVIEKESGEQALYFTDTHEETIDMLLSDVVMPVMNGKELHDRLLAKRPGMKALFMSGYTETIVGHHGVLDEGTHFIQKPFDIEVLTRKVREVLGQ